MPIPAYIFRTVSSPVVRVEVFPVSTSITEPEISSASMFFIRRLSSISFSIEKAIDIDTASGNPSGTQTMSSAMVTWILLRIFSTVSCEMKSF